MKRLGWCGVIVLVAGVTLLIGGTQVSNSAFNTESDLSRQYTKYCTVGQYIDPEGCARLRDGYNAAVGTASAAGSVAVLGLYVLTPVGLLMLGASRALHRKPTTAASVLPDWFCPKCGERYRGVEYCPHDGLSC